MPGISAGKSRVLRVMRTAPFTCAVARIIASVISAVVAPGAALRTAGESLPQNSSARFALFGCYAIQPLNIVISYVGENASHRELISCHDIAATVFQCADMNGRHDPGSFVWTGLCGLGRRKEAIVRAAPLRRRGEPQPKKRRKINDSITESM